MEITKIFGAAGTGKTTYIYEQILKKIPEEEIENVIALSFTVAAKKAILEKDKRLDEKQVRTLHSLCFSKLGLTPEDLVTQEEIRQFFNQKGIFYRPEEIFDDETEDKKNVGLMLLKWWGRLYNEAPLYFNEKGKIKITEFIKNYPQIIDSLSIKMFVDFVKDFHQFLKERGKVDFNQVIFEAFRRKVNISGSYFIIDEAQDLSPIMVEIIKQNIQNFDHIIIAGDDDQTIYTPVNGARAELLLKFKEDNKIILNKSWRLPIKVWKLGNLIVKNIKEREKKKFSPREEEGLVKVIYELPLDSLKDAKEKTFILCRHKKDVLKFARLLSSKGIAFEILGKGLKEEYEKVRRRLIPALYLFKKIRNFPNLEDQRISTKMVEGFYLLLKDNLKKIIFPDIEIPEMIHNKYILELTVEKLLKDYPKLKNIIDNFPPEVLFHHQTFSGSKISRWYRKIEKGNIAQWLSPTVFIGTIHQSKGLEASKVILYLGVNRKTYHSLRTDYERRVWYVGVTRSSKELYLLVPQTSLFNEEVFYFSQLT